MIYALAAAIGLCAAVLLYFAGYVGGLKRSAKVRDRLVHENAQQSRSLQETSRALAYQQGKTEVLQADSKEFVSVLQNQAEALERMIGQLIEPLVERRNELGDLRALFQQLLAPVMRRQQISLDLANLQAGVGERGSLVPLLDQIAEKGQFQAVLLSDQHGLPLAASQGARELDRLAAVSAMVLLFVDRFPRDGAAAPLALMIQDDENTQTLCRVFRVRGHQLLLTAVARGTQLSPNSLDPTLPKLDVVLSTP